MLLGRRRTRALGIPSVDFSPTARENRGALSQIIVEACQELGFFKVVNHGVSQHVVTRLEKLSIDFFQKPAAQKQKAGPPNPFGYGCKNIGFNGDKGELEYLLMEANPVSVRQRSTLINSDRPLQFGCAVNDYISAVREVAWEILDLVEEGLCGTSSHHSAVLSELIRDVDSDSCFRINRYPPALDMSDDGVGPNKNSNTRVGFGEHSDPQILTILRSNEVPGLEICSSDGVWIPVQAEPEHLFVFVGDALEALTNGRLKSVRHRVVANSGKPRISMMYFGAPALNAWINPLPKLLTRQSPRLYRGFSWGEFKKAVYASRLADHRLHLFKFIPR